MCKSVKVLLMFCLLCFLIAIPGHAKDVNGVLHGNVTWDGYIHVVGDVKVAKDGFLTIKPGTVVEFAANQNIDPLQNFGPNRSWIIVNGGIDARGTLSEWITFTSDAENPNRGDWGCIGFLKLQRNSIFQYCDISYGIDHINTAGYKVGNSTIQIYNCIMHHSNDRGTGVLVGQSGELTFIKYNTIYECRTGIDVYENEAPKHLEIKNNIITHNLENGIDNEGGVEIDTEFNNVWNNPNNYEEDDPIDHSRDIQVDPRYVDLANNNVHLQSGSPCLAASKDGGEIGAYGSVNYSYNVDKPSDDGGGGGCVMNPHSSRGMSWLILLTLPAIMIIRRVRV